MYWAKAARSFVVRKTPKRFYYLALRWLFLVEVSFDFHVE
jgi:hypothetical protein